MSSIRIAALSVVLLAAGFALFASPSFAQSACPTTTGSQESVCNLDQAADNRLSVSSPNYHQMPFHTGDAANGYVLNSLHIDIQEVGTESDLRIALHADDGSGNAADDALVVLMLPFGSAAVGVNEVTASGITLSADANYYLNFTSSVGGWVLQPTLSSAQTGSTGWTIGERNFIRPGSTNFIDANANARFAVVATRAAATTTYAPHNVLATAGDAQISATWSAPGAGRTPSGYDLCVYSTSDATAAFADSNCTGAAVTAVTGTTATRTGLTNGTAYWAAVRTTHAGSSTNSDWVAARGGVVTPAGLETSAPTDITVTPGEQQLTIGWTAPTAVRVPTGYAICVYAPSAATDAFAEGSCTGGALTTATSAQITAGAVTVGSLTNGTAYWTAVRGTHADGNSDWVAADAVATPMATTTAAPTTVSILTPTGGGFEVGWNAGTPTASGEVAATGYQICTLGSQGTGTTFDPADCTAARVSDAPSGVTKVALTLPYRYSSYRAAVRGTGGTEPSDWVAAGLFTNDADDTLTQTSDLDPRLYSLRFYAGTDTSASGTELTLTPAFDRNAQGAVDTEENYTYAIAAGNTAQVTMVYQTVSSGTTTNGGIDTLASVSSPLTIALEADGSTTYLLDTELSDGNPGHQYSFTITSGAVTPPDAPTAVTATARTNGVTVGWTAPTTTPTPTGYDICFYAETTTAAFADSNCTGSAVVAATDLEVTAGEVIHSNTVDSAFWYAVRSKVAGVGGESAWVAASARVTPLTKVAAPSGATASAGNARIDVSWTIPAPAAGFAADLEFTACAIPATTADFPDARDDCTAFAEVDAPVATTTITGLANGTAYKVAVRAWSLGLSVGSAWVEATTGSPFTPRAALTAPDAPTGVAAQSADRALTVRWTAPASDGGTAITRYEVCALRGATFTAASCTGGALTTAAATATSAEVSGLVNGDEYSLAVRAVNAEGNGEFSTPITATPRDLSDRQPATAMATASTVSSATITVTWTAPGDTTADGYQVCIHEGAVFNAGDVCDGATPAEAAAVSTTVTNIDSAATLTHTRNSGLTNGETYAIGVRATYPSGDPSAWTSPPPVVPGDGMPDAFTIELPSGAGTIEPGATIRSDAFTVAGINYEVPISVTGGMIEIGSGAAATSGMVDNGDSVVVIITAAACDNPATATVTIGEGDNAVPADFTVSTRACSTDATLSALVLNDGTNDLTLTPAFATATLTYSARVAGGVRAVTVTATPTDANAQSSVSANAQALEPGPNTVTITVTAESGEETSTYTINVIRTAPPTGVSSTVEGSTLTVTWVAPVGGVTGYEGFDVCVHEGMTFDDALCTTATIEREAATATSHTRSGLDTGVTYVSAVRSIGVNADDVGDWTQGSSGAIGARVAADSGAVITRAITGIANAAIATRVAQAGAPAGIGGASFAPTDWERTASRVIRAQSGDLGDGMKELLDGNVLALTGGGIGAAPAFWVSGDYLDVRGEDGDPSADGMKWDGEVISLQLGADALTANGALLGAALARSESDIDYTAGGEEGDQQMTLNSIHPYIGWRTRGGSDLWGSIAYGSGELERTPDGGETRTDDLSLSGAAFGGAFAFADGARILGGIEAARMTIDGAAEDDGDLEIDAHRVRFGSEWSGTARHGDATVRRALEAGVRYDGGDGVTGGGVEVGYRIAYRTPRGSTATLRARVLAAHDSDYNEWGIGAALRYAPGADGQGFAARMEPSWGATGSRADALLNGDLAELASGESFAPSARMTGEVNYGIAYADGMLTPYSGFALREDGRDLSLGMRYRLRLAGVAGPVEMSMEGYRQERDAVDGRDGVRVKAGMTW